MRRKSGAARWGGLGIALALTVVFGMGAPAVAGQNITIDSSYSADDVHGNGEGDFGTPKVTPDTTATGNTVTVGAGGDVDDMVYGSFTYSTGSDDTSATNSSVTVVVISMARKSRAAAQPPPRRTRYSSKAAVM